MTLWQSIFILKCILQSMCLIVYIYIYALLVTWMSLYLAIIFSRVTCTEWPQYILTSLKKWEINYENKSLSYTDILKLKFIQYTAECGAMLVAILLNLWKTNFALTIHRVFKCFELTCVEDSYIFLWIMYHWFMKFSH